MLMSIQALRGIAFFLIFLWHINILHLGSAGVSIFFILSGFLLMNKYKGKYPQPQIRDSARFTWDHIKKLYFLHVITAVACVPILLQMMHHDWLRVFKRILVNLLLIQTWFTQYDIRYSLNHPSWYLSAMLFIYFVFPHFRSFLRFCRTRKSLLLLMAAAALIQFFYNWVIYRHHLSGKIDYNTMRALIYNEPYTRACDFLIGCVLGRLYALTPNTEASDGIIDVLCILLFITTCVLREVLYVDNCQWFTLGTLCIPGSCGIIWAFMCNNCRFVKHISSLPWLIFLGNISGPAFLIHQPIIRYLVRFMPVLNSDFKHRLILGLIALFATILMSYTVIQVKAILDRASWGHKDRNHVQ